MHQLLGFIASLAWVAGGTFSITLNISYFILQIESVTFLQWKRKSEQTTCRNHTCSVHSACSSVAQNRSLNESSSSLLWSGSPLCAACSRYWMFRYWWTRAENMLTLSTSSLSSTVSLAVHPCCWTQLEEHSHREFPRWTAGKVQMAGGMQAAVTWQRYFQTSLSWAKIKRHEWKLGC